MRPSVHAVVMRGEHFSSDGEGFASHLPRKPRRPSSRLPDGLRKSFRLAISASLFTVFGFIGLLLSFDPGQSGQRPKMGLALVFGLAQWGVVYLLGNEDPWPGDAPE